MCITFFRFDPDATFPFIIAFNRDEVNYREAVPAEWHSKYKNIICGLDKETGTTWLALNKKTG